MNRPQDNIRSWLDEFGYAHAVGGDYNQAFANALIERGTRLERELRAHYKRRIARQVPNMLARARRAVHGS